MKLYYAPNACSLGIHVLLEEIGKPFELSKVDMANGANYKPPFTELNPKSKVPVLVADDGTVITEFPAIAFYLAASNQEAKLLPADIAGQTLALQTLDYLIATIHMRGFTRIFRPGNFAPNPADVDQVKQAGRDMILAGFKILEPLLGEQEFILGDFSIVEGALFFLEFWARTRVKMLLPANFEAHLDRMLKRPAVQRAMATEGLSA